MTKTLKLEKLEELSDMLDVQSPYDLREHLSKLTYADLCWLATALRTQLDSKAAEYAEYADSLRLDRDE